MIRKYIASLFEDVDIVRNISFLSLIKLVEGVSAIIVLYLLAKTLGVQEFGVLSFVIAIMTVCLFIVDFGFDISATRQIAINSESKNDLNRIYSSVIYIKLALALVCISGVLIMILSIDSLLGEPILYLLYFGMILGRVFNPVWLFQGMNKIELMFVGVLISKFIHILLLFLLVTGPKDILFAVIAHSMGEFFLGIMGFFSAYIKFNLLPRSIKIGSIMEIFKESAIYFVSNISILIYSVSATILLGVFTNPSIVGVYSFAEKIIKLLQSLLMPILQGIFPRISKIATFSLQKSLEVTKIYAIFCLVLTALLGLVMFFSSEIIVRILFSQMYDGLSLLLKVLSFIPLLSTLNYILGTQIMVPFNLRNYFLNIHMFCTIFFVILVTAALMFGVAYYIVAYIWILTEFVMAGLLLFVLNKKKILFFQSVN